MPPRPGTRAALITHIYRSWRYGSLDVMALPLWAAPLLDALDAAIEQERARKSSEAKYSEVDDYRPPHTPDWVR